MARSSSMLLQTLDDTTQCSHLASGDYRAQIAFLCNKYPSLRYPDRQSPIPKSASRVVSFDLSVDGEPTRRDFEDPVALQSFLEATKGSGLAGRNTSRRLFLVEGVEPRFVRVLGHYFDIDPLLIVRQQRTASWESYHQSGNTPTLPSLFEPSRSLSIPYYELHYYPQGLPDRTEWRCADSGRQVSSSRLPGTFDRVGIVHRKASYWSQRRGNDGWDGRFLSKPCLAWTPGNSI